MTYSIDGVTYTNTSGIFNLVTHGTTYSVTAKNAAGCVSPSTSVTINTQPAAPNATIAYTGSLFSTAITQPVNVTQTGTSGGLYTASPSGLSINSLTGAITPGTSKTGIYIVSYTIAAGGGCPALTKTASITITLPKITTLQYSGSRTVQNGSTASLTATLRNFSQGINGQTITFTIGSQSITALTKLKGRASTTMVINQAPGSYQVISTYAGNGYYKSCSHNETFTITGVKSGGISSDELPSSQNERNGCDIFIPNGFSPDGDGINDYFKIACIEEYPDAKLMIYSGVSALLYEQDHYGNLDFWGSEDAAWWNGTDKGKNKLPAGSYIYILDLDNGRKDLIKTGVVFVSR
jgi:gliding motility-associated-like protein